MNVQTKSNFTSVPPLFSYVPHCARWVIRNLRRVRSERGIARANAAMLKTLRSSGAPIKINLGSGPHLGKRGWTNVDLVSGCDLRFDISHTLPFRDGEVDEIYSSHVLEYFDYRDMMKILAEWRRILRPGGRLRVAVPDARIWAKAYLNIDEPFDADYYCRYKPALNFHSRIDYLNYVAYMDRYHRHMFDEDNLVAILAASGFCRATPRQYDPEIDLDSRVFESIYATAIK